VETGIIRTIITVVEEAGPWRREYSWAALGGRSRFREAEDSAEGSFGGRACSGGEEEPGSGFFNITTKMNIKTCKKLGRLLAIAG